MKTHCDNSEKKIHIENTLFIIIEHIESNR